MPNWCYNSMRVWADGEEAKNQLKEFVKCSIVKKTREVYIGDEAKPKKEEVPPLTATLNDLKQVEKLRKAYQKEIGDVKSAVYKTERVDGKYKLIVTGLTKQQRQK